MSKRFGERLSYANVMATAAVFIALGGSAWAVAANSVGTKQLRNGAVKTKKLANGAVKTPKIANGAVATPKINHGAVTTSRLANESVTSAKIAALGLEDVGITVTEVTVNTPALAAGQCAFALQTVPGLTADEGLLAYSGSSWDSRLMISGVESLPTVGDFVLEICNWTPSTNLAAGSGSVTLLRF